MWVTKQRVINIFIAINILIAIQQKLLVLIAFAINYRLSIIEMSVISVADFEFTYGAVHK